MDTTVTETEAPRSKRWIVGIALIVAGIAGLAAWAIGTPNAVAYYRTPSELTTMDAGQRIRVGGRLVDDSLQRTGSTATFAVTDGKEQLAVTYRGEVPDTLKNGSDVIVEGHPGTDSFVADRVMAKCSSKFVPKDKPQHLGRT